MTRPAFHAILLAGLLASCVGDVLAADSAPLLTLDQALQIAIANNRPLQIASLDVEKSKWQVIATKTHRLPAFNTAMFASSNLNSPTFVFKEGQLGTLKNGDPIPATNTTIPLSHGITGYALAQVAQPITQLYKIHLAIREQQLAEDLSSQQYRAQRQSVVSDVKQAYYAVLQTESALDSADAAVKQYEETDRVTLQYVAQEAVLKSDSLEVKAKLAQAKYQVIDLQNTLQTQKEHLNDLLGRDLETDFRTQQVPPVSLEETDLKFAQQTALAQRPEIQEAVINVQKADYDRKLAKADYIPNISAAFHYFTPLNTAILPQNIASAGLDMTWEPFEWGRKRDEVKQKVISLDQAQFQLKQAQSQVVLDVNNRYRKLSQSLVLLDVAQAAREAATQKLREVQDKYGEQAVLLRDVLQQQSALAGANHDYEQALLGFWSAKADFEKALGEE
jgi:outer membrane protein